MDRHDFYRILKAHAEKVDNRYTFKVIDLKVACAEIEDALSHLHKQVVMQGLLSDCCQAAITTTEIHYCKECECSCSPTVGQRSGDTVAERRDFYCWSQNNGSSKCVEVCETCKRVSGVPTRGNRD